MPTHPLWRPFQCISAADAARAHVSGREGSGAPMQIEVVAPDPRWAAAYCDLSDDIRNALDGVVLTLAHVGSTSVPLDAKPILDIDLTVADSADEPAYVPQLARAHFSLVIREPDWEQHRCLVRERPRCNLHVFSRGATEPQRHLAFRDWLRDHRDDREGYAALKRELARRPWPSTMAYNNEKARLIYEIYERIFAADPKHPHTPSSPSE